MLDWPEATITLVGSVTMALLLARATMTPEGAAALSVSVHEALPALVKVEGEHVTVPTLSGVGTKIDPPEPVAGIALPLTDTATTLEI